MLEILETANNKFRLFINKQTSRAFSQMNPKKPTQLSIYKSNHLWHPTIHLCSKNFQKCPPSKIGWIQSSCLNSIPSSIRWTITQLSVIKSSLRWWWVCCRAYRPQKQGNRAAVNIRIVSLRMMVRRLQ